MEIFAEDMGRVAMMRITAKETIFGRITPQRIGNVDIAIVGKAKVVVCHNASREELKQLLQGAETSTAIRDAWVLVADGEVCYEFAKWVHPYVTIVMNDRMSAEYEQFSRGWNVETETGEHSQKNVIAIGANDIVEVLFGESRENPIGLLSIKCLKK